MTGGKILVSASQLERELQISHGTIVAAVNAGIITPIYLPDHKRPKYNRKEVFKAFGVM